jgi:hypothetical protein
MAWHGLSASLAMPCQVREKAGAHRVKPMPFFAEMDTCFVGMQEPTSQQSLLDLLHGALESL